MAPYERLLGDAMRGDASLFARQDAVEAPGASSIRSSSRPRRVAIYEPGTWGPADARER